MTVRDDRRGRLDFERFYRVGGQGEGDFQFEQIDKAQTGADGRILNDVELVISDAGEAMTKTAIRGEVRGDNGAIDRALDVLVASSASSVTAVQEGARAPKYVWDEDSEQDNGLAI